VTWIKKRKLKKKHLLPYPWKKLQLYLSIQYRDTVTTDESNYRIPSPPGILCLLSTGWPKKSKPPPIFQKIVLNIANEIRFLRKVKV